MKMCMRKAHDGLLRYVVYFKEFAIVASNGPSVGIWSVHHAS